MIGYSWSPNDPRNRSEMMFYDAYSGVTFFLSVISHEDRANQSHIATGSAPILSEYEAAHTGATRPQTEGCVHANRWISVTSHPISMVLGAF